MRYLFESHDANTAGGAGFSFVMTSSVIVAGLVVLSVLLFSKRLDLAFTYRPVLPLLALGCFLIPLLETSSIVPYFFARTGYICFEILNWVMLSDTAYRWSISSNRVFGLGRAGVSGGILLGSFFGWILTNSSELPPYIAAGYSGALVLILIIASSFALTERDVARITKQRIPQNTPALSLEDKAGILAQQHELGERATQVLILLVKGRTGSRIEQELYISKGTVNYHLRTIYHKLGVHSRQELLDLVESVEPLDVEAN